MAVLEHVISDADMNGANGIIADDELLDEETRQILSLCSAVLIQFHPPRLRPAPGSLPLPLYGQAPRMRGGSRRHRPACQSFHQAAGILAPDIVLPPAEHGRLRIPGRRGKPENAGHGNGAGSATARQEAGQGPPQSPWAALVTPEAEEQQSLNVNLLFIIRSIERIGDIAKTIAAAVVFLKEATDIRHGRDK